MSHGGDAPSRRLLDRQKEAAERLRREVMGVDGSLDHPYFHALKKSCQDYRETVDLDSLVERAAQAGLVFIGDFHAVPANALFVADLLERLTARGVRCCLGIEFVFTRQQRLLTRRQRGEIDDATFHRRMHYREEWGYPWVGYRTLLDTARALEIPVEALDLPPRVGYGGLRRRDAHAGRRIAELICQQPERCMVVFYGESHVTAGHLPAQTARALKREQCSREALTVFQDPDALYWHRVAKREALARPVVVDDQTMAVFHSSPLEKYEAYRQVLDRWQSDLPLDEEIDLTPAVHHLIGVLASWIGVRPERRKLRHRAGWSEELVDAYPEVYSGPEAGELLAPILEEHGRSAAEIAEARLRLIDAGALYESRSNTMFLTRYLPGPAAAEAARFLRTALTGRLFLSPDDFLDDKSQAAYAAAYAAALAYLGARLVDPVCDFGGSVVQASGGAGTAAVDATHQRWLRKHQEFERSADSLPDMEALRELRESRALRRALARNLGARLGAELVERVRSGQLEKEGLRKLFTRPLRAGHAARDVLKLLRGGVRL